MTSPSPVVGTSATARLLPGHDRFWEAPELLHRGRLRSRSPLVSCPDVDTARRADTFAAAHESPWWRTLDGRWRFRRFDRPEDVPLDAVAPRTDDSGWEPWEVPGAWTMGGGDPPQYTNVQMPFPGQPPRVPAANPTGVHRRWVDVPAEWQGRRVVLRLGGAESVAVLYVDGHRVGVSKGSRLPAEWEVTHLLTPGAAHLVSVVVIRWSDASWVEDQDQWWHAGIFRSVSMFCTPEVHLGDVALVPGLSADGGTGTLDVSVRVDAPEDAGGGALGPGWSVRVDIERQLPDRVHQVAATGALEVPAFAGADPLSELLSATVWAGPIASTRIEVPGIVPWSDEVPQLYRVLVRLIDPAGVEVEAVACRTGFRRVEVGDRSLLVNGARVWIKGVNRHEFDPSSGRTQRLEAVRAELELMKRHNVNAIRCAHYPNEEGFYDLCDELGFYVVDEADIESHGRQAALCHDERYHAAILDRGSRMVLRDRNHPCVILWSLGNEAGDGAGQSALAAWIRRTDPSRPLHYEGPLMHDLHAEAPDTDVVCPMYASIDQIVEWSDRSADRRRPLILCEYSHAMGNSNGSLADYWAEIRSRPGLQGGFIWEWRDHGLRQVEADGRVWYAHGGDFGEERHDANFVCDGLLGADGSPHPALVEVAWVYAPVRITGVDVAHGVLSVANDRFFSGVDDLRLRWEVSRDGHRVSSGVVDLDDIGPQTDGELRIPVRPVSADGEELWLTVTAVTASPSAGVPRGHIVAWAQFPLATTSRRTPPQAIPAVTGEGAGATTNPPTAGRGTVSAGGWTLVAGPHGWELSREGTPVFTAAPVPSLYRAPIDNDGLKQGWTAGFGHVSRWRSWGLDRPTLGEGGEGRVSVRRLPGGTGARMRRSVAVICPGMPDHPVTWSSSWAVGADGTVEIREEIVVPAELADIPRVGVGWEFPPGWEGLEFFGEGPHECYSDRRSAALVGRWSSSVSGQYVPYAVPQEHGHHTGARWVRLRGPASSGGIEIRTLGETFEFNATHYPVDDLSAASHAHLLTPRPSTFLYLDAAHRGVGTASCGPDTLDRYRVGAGRYRLAFVVRHLR